MSQAAGPARRGALSATGSGGRRLTGPLLTPEAKTAPPHPREHDVVRTTVLTSLAEARGIVLVVAPAGYGKTSVAAQAAAAQSLPVAWATLDVTDDDPVVLVSTLLAALARGGAAPGPLTGRLTGDEPTFSRRVLPSFRRAVERVGRPVHVVLDEVHLLTSAAAALVLQGLADSLPEGSRLVLVGRRSPPLPVGRWRAAGRLTEVGPEALAFDTAETAAVLAGLGGAPPSDDQLARVQSATDGWPVAVYLTWRAHRAGHDLDDYLDSEVFTDVDADLLDLLQRTSVATALSGPLCAALLEDPAAIDLLREAARSTPLVTVLQGEDPWFRVHPLLRERLLADLVERDPALVLALHARAAEWYAAKGLADDAVEHALRSERADLVGRVLWEPAIAALLVGRNSRIAAWLARVPDEEIAAHPPLAVVAAWACVQRGEASGVQRWGEAAERVGPSSWHQEMDSSEQAALLGLLHTTSMRAGYDASADLALRCDRALPSTHPARPLALTLAGAGRLLGGRHEEAIALLRRGHTLAVAADVGTTAVEALSVLSVALGAQGDTSAAWEAAATAERIWQAQDLHDSASSTGLLRSATAPLRAVRGDSEGARRDLEQLAATQAAGEASPLPWLSVIARVGAAEALLALADRSAASVALARARVLLAMVPPSPFLALLVARADRALVDAGPLASLSPAEQAVWSYVGTRLTVKEIAEQMYLSADTVKTHLSSIYRKLGLASRREAQQLYDDLAAGGRPTTSRGGAQADVS